MAKTQKYGIAFPITIKSMDKTMLDLNKTRAEMVKSEIMHLLFTPKGQRLRSPNFGSRLIQFIFNPNDQDTWTDIVSEFKDMVKQWVPYCQIKDMTTDISPDGDGILVQVRYSVTERDGETQECELVAAV